MLPDFRRVNSASILNTLREHQSRPHPFQNQTSKPKSLKALKANANCSFPIANVQTLRFYQNKGLSTDKRCVVPNTFSIRNQTFKLKDQDLFFTIHIRLGKLTFFLALNL